jgi:hypothetical protein
MTEPRPYERTTWEEEEKGDRDTVVDHAAAAVEHADAAMQDLINVSKDIAANSAAVEQLTRESLITDNVRFRRRNAVLVFLSAVLLVGLSFLLYRDVYVSGPQRDKVEAVADRLEECTTPGPRTPTAEDPTTGNDCFDEGQARTAVAISQIVDADQNGKVDSQEILDYLKQFDVFLELADDVPPAGG